MGERRRTQEGGRCAVAHREEFSPVSSPSCEGTLPPRSLLFSLSSISLVSSPSCVGRLPVRLLLPHNLREGRRSGRRGGERCPWGHQIRGGRQIRGVPRPCATPPPYATTPTRGPPSVPSQRRSPNPSLQTGIDPLPPRRVRWRYTAGGATERTVWCRCKCRADRRIVGGECDTRASPTRRCPLSPPTTLRTFPPPTLRRLGGGGADVRWLTGAPAR